MKLKISPYDVSHMIMNPKNAKTGRLQKIDKLSLN